MATAIASMFVRVRPQTDTAQFKKDGDAAGRAAGQSYADGFYRDSAGKLRQANGRFATDAQKQMVEGGKRSGGGFGDAFNSTGGGIIRKGFLKLKNELGPLLVPLGIGGAIAAIGKIGIEYENNLNIFQAVTKATGNQMDIVAGKARQLGADVNLPGVSAAGAASAMTELAKAGFTVQQAMDAAAGTLQLARIANISEGSAAEIAANAVNAFGISAKDTGFVVDELAASANSSSVEIGEVSDGFKMAAAVFSGFQVPAVGSKEAITELNTALAILGNNGIKGSDAGTSLKQALLQLVAPSDQARGFLADINAQAMHVNVSMSQQNAILHGSKKERGLAVAAIYDHNKALSANGDLVYDADGKMRSLREIIGRLTEGTKGWTQEDRNLAISQIFGADATRSILALMKGGLPIYDAQRTAVLEQGAAAAVAAAKNKGLGGALDNVKSQFENAAIAIYNQVKGPLTTGLNGLANVIAPLAGDIESFANTLSNNAGTVRAIATAVGIAVAAWATYRTALILAAAAQSAWAAIQGAIAFIQLASQVRNLSGAWALLNLVMDANPIGIVVVALAALTAGIVYAWNHSETFRTVVLAVWGAIKTAISATVSWIVTYVWPVLKAAWDGIAAGALWLWHNAIEPAWHGIQAAWQGIATGALWLWHNVMEPVWHGIQAVVGGAITAVKTTIDIGVAVFRGIATVAQWLYTNIFAPVFGAIGKVVEIWWLAVRVVFMGLYDVLKIGIGAALNVARTVFAAVFGFINTSVIQPWWAAIKAVFGFFRDYIIGPLFSALTAAKNFFASVFSAVGAFVSAWWNSTVRPVFGYVRAGWDALAAAFSAIYNNAIKPVFSLFVGFIKGTVVDGFRAGVDLIKKAWEGVKAAAEAPVRFVVEQVINPFIGGLNAAARIVGVKDQVTPIKLGFADGGQVPGYASGGRITGAPSSTDNRLAPARIPGVGAVKLAGGEFVVNAKDTRRALPLLSWINNGMRGGPTSVSRMIGRRLTDMPGDGSEGWAFKDGGLVGWAEDVWGAVTDPVGSIEKPFLDLLGRIPGGGMVRNFLTGGGKRLLSSALTWIKNITGFGGSGTLAGHIAGGNVGAAMNFLHANDGKPYVWASAGPGGFDCSGIVSAVYNIMHGSSPYSHIFSTESAGPFFPKSGPGLLTAAWSHPGQAPASASVGHMMGRIGSLTFESTGSQGVHLGTTTRNINDFANIGHYANGGRVTPALYDGGGSWPSGTLGYNASGHTEHVMTGGPSGDMAAMLDRLDDIVAALSGLGGDVAEALQSPIRKSVTRGRTFGPNVRYA